MSDFEERFHPEKSRFGLFLFCENDTFLHFSCFLKKQDFEMKFKFSLKIIKWNKKK